MRGLTSGPARPTGRWSRTERGAVAVMVAVLMVPLMTIAALVVDLADLYSERQRLQTGTDATALAVATDCLRGSCGTLATTARTFTKDNMGGGTNTPSGTVSVNNGTVTVVGKLSVSHFFAPVFGVSSSTVSTKATATYSAPSAGTAVLPIAINACEYNLVTGGRIPTGTAVRTLNFASVNSGCYAAPGIPDAKLNSPYVQPGGFAWLKPTSGCTVSTSLTADPQIGPNGAGAPASSCTTAYFGSLLDTTVLVPVFDSYSQPNSSNSTNVYFSIYGYVGFHITGGSFDGGTYNTTCNGSQRCVDGYFTRLTTQASGFTYDGTGPQLGAGAVKLTG